MPAEQISVVGNVQPCGIVGFYEAGRLIGGYGGSLRFEPLRQAIRVSVWIPCQEKHRQVTQRFASAAQQFIDDRLRVQIPVCLESREKHFSGFFIRDLSQHLRANRIVDLVEHGVCIVRQPSFVEANQVTQETDINEVYRMIETFA